MQTIKLFVDSNQDENSDSDYFIENVLPRFLAIYKGNTTKLLFTQLKRNLGSIHSLIDKEPLNPQDSADVL